MMNLSTISRTSLLLAGFAFTLSIGFYLGMKFSETIEKKQPVILDQGSKLEEMQHTTDVFLKAWNNGDVKGIGNTYANDAIFMPPNLPSIQGRSEIMDFFKEQEVSNTTEMEIAETVQEVIYFDNWAVMRGLGEISIQNTDSTMNKIPFKWVMLSKKNPHGKWESVWDIYNDL